MAGGITPWLRRHLVWVFRTMTAVREVIFYRHNHGRPTWVTTWMNRRELAERYGDGIAGRAQSLSLLGGGEPRRSATERRAIDR